MTDPITPSTPEPSGPPAYTPTGAGAGTAPRRGLSLAAFILGIVAVVFSFIVTIVGLIAGIVGLILALLARSREPEAPRWMKLLGLIFSIVGIVLSIILIIVAVIVAASVLKSGS